MIHKPRQQSTLTDLRGEDPSQKSQYGVTYVSSHQNNVRNVKSRQEDSNGSLPGSIGIVQAIIGIIGALIAIFAFLGTNLPPALVNVMDAVTATGNGIDGALRPIGPLFAAIALLFVCLILRLFAERTGMFITPGIRDIMRIEHGSEFLLLELVLSSLLFLPVLALWVSLFYGSVPAWEVGAFGVAYLLTTLLASVMSGGVFNHPTLASIGLGQFLSVTCSLTTLLVFIAQSTSARPSPLDNAGIDAVMALVATIAARLLAELAGFFVTTRLNLPQFLSAFFLLSPLAAVWIGYFYSTVSTGALVAFCVAYVATVAFAHILSKGVRPIGLDTER